MFSFGRGLFAKKNQSEDEDSDFDEDDRSDDDNSEDEEMDENEGIAEIQVNKEDEVKNDDSKKNLPKYNDKLNVNRDPVNPFYLFKVDKYNQYRRNYPELTRIEITDLIAQEWGRSDNSIQTKYHEKFEKLHGEIEKREKEREEKRVSENKRLGKVTPPKKPLTAFFLFKGDHVDEIKKQNPGARLTEISAIIAQRWKDLDPETKQAYEKKNEELQKKYEQEMKEFEEKNTSTGKRKGLLTYFGKGGNQEGPVLKKSLFG